MRKFWFVDLSHVTSKYEKLFAFVVIFMHFSRIISYHSCQKCCIFTQTCKDSVFNQYTHLGMLKCQIWLQVMESSSFYCVFMIILTYNRWIFIFEVLNLLQTFSYCVSNQATHFGMLTSQMWLQVMKRLSISLFFKGISTFNQQPFVSKVLYLHQTYTDSVSYQYTHFGMLTNQKWL